MMINLPQQINSFFDVFSIFAQQIFPDDLNYYPHRPQSIILYILLKEEEKKDERIEMNNEKPSQFFFEYFL